MLPETKLDIMLVRHASLEAELSRPLGADAYVKLSRELAEIAHIHIGHRPVVHVRMRPVHYVVAPDGERARAGIGAG